MSFFGVFFCHHYFYFLIIKKYHHKNAIFSHVVLRSKKVIESGHESGMNGDGSHHKSGGDSEIDDSSKPIPQEDGPMMVLINIYILSLNIYIFLSLLYSCRINHYYCKIKLIIVESIIINYCRMSILE